MATARASVDGSDTPIAVVGAGVIGLSAALRLAEAGYRNITVIGAEWTPNTTSDGAGAYWERRSPGHAAWARETMTHYSRLVASGAGVDSGVAFIEGWQWHHAPLTASDIDFRVDVPSFRKATPAEVAAAAARTGQRLVDGIFYTAVIADSPTYLRWLMDNCTRRGVVFIQRKVASLSELASYFDVIVNCTGMGARELASDGAVHVARGQVIRVYAPHVTQFQTVSAGPGSYWHGAYILPRLTSGVVTLGGTYQEGREFYGLDAADGRSIWEGCCAVCPELKDPRTIKIEEWTGMRPARDGDVRLELDAAPVAAPSGGRAARVVHNYGHGGCGHSLHWGCAGDAVALVNQAVGQLPASRPAPAGVYRGPAPLIIEGMQTILPRLMGGMGSAPVALPMHVRLQPRL